MYMGYQLQQKSMTLNDNERQLTALSSVLYAYCDETAAARNVRFSL